MAGTIVANTINTDTGIFSTNNAYLGIAKAWVNFTPSTGAIVSSFNISSVTRNGNSDYTVNFSTAMTDANYCVTDFNQYQRGCSQPTVTKTTTSYRANTFANDANGSASDLYVGWWVFFGN
jgi:hypothetical protein